MKDTVKAIVAGHWASFKRAISLIELWHETAKAMGEGVFEDSLLKVLNQLLADDEIEESVPNYFQPK